MEKISRFEIDPYNSYQNFLYNRAIKGLSIYTEEELHNMCEEKKKRIIKVQRKVQRIINLLKQEVTNHLANDLFIKIFPDTEFTKSLVHYYGTGGDENHINKLSFSFLKMNKKLIITRLIEKKMLPKNFNLLIPKEHAI